MSKFNIKIEKAIQATDDVIENNISNDNNEKQCWRCYQKAHQISESIYLSYMLNFNHSHDDGCYLPGEKNPHMENLTNTFESLEYILNWCEISNEMNCVEMMKAKTIFRETVFMIIKVFTKSDNSEAIVLANQLLKKDL